MPASTKSTEPIRLLDFRKRFATDETREHYLFKVRWPEGFVSPRCGPTANDKPLFVKMQVLPVLTAEELSGFVLDNVDPEASVVTDSFQGYLGLSVIAASTR